MTGAAVQRVSVGLGRWCFPWPLRWASVCRPRSRRRTSRPRLLRNSRCLTRRRLPRSYNRFSNCGPPSSSVIRATRPALRAEAAKSPLPQRPARTVTPPTLTSHELDGLLAQYLKKTNPKVDPAPITSDVEFVRRVHLDLTGKPPTPAQFISFVNDRSKDKRARLIDDLLQSPEYAGTGPILARRDQVPRHQPGRSAGTIRRAGRLADRAVQGEQALGRDRHGR